MKTKAIFDNCYKNKFIFKIKNKLSPKHLTNNLLLKTQNALKKKTKYEKLFIKPYKTYFLENYSHILIGIF